VSATNTFVIIKSI